MDNPNGEADVQRPRSQPALLEKGFAVVAIFFFTDAVRLLLLNPNGQGTVSLATDSISKPALLFIYAITAAALAMDWRRTLKTAASTWPVLLIVGLGFASVFWSTDPSVSLKNAIWLAGSTAFGVYLSQRFGLSGLLRLLGIALFLVLGISVIFALFAPRLGIDPGLHANAWRGAFLHKNSFGRMMVLSATVFATLAFDSRRQLPIMLLLTASTIVLVLLSKSSTSVAIIALLVSVPLFKLISFRLSLSRARAFLVALAIVATVAVSAVAFSEQLLASVGKDSSLTGRTLLWAAVAQELTDRPVLGFGFQAFWLGKSAEFAEVWAIVRWAPPNAHNGYLDAVVSFGIAGGIFVLGVLGLYLSKSFTLAMERNAGARRIWPFCFMVFFLLSNIGESALVQQNHLLWILFVAISCSTSLLLSQYEEGQSPHARETLLSHGP